MIKPLIALFGAILCLLGTGCTHVQKPKIQRTTLAAEAKSGALPLKVALVMDAAWTNYTFQFSKMGDTWKYPLGASMIDYARNVTGHSFRQVVEFVSADAAANQADVILQPRVAKSDQAMGMLAWQDRTLVFLVEWTARDAANRNTVWLTTIDAKAAHNAGNMFTFNGNERKLFQKIFDDLSNKTVKAFAESPELKAISPAR